MRGANKLLAELDGEPVSRTRSTPRSRRAPRASWS
jgi:hypothetical protein